MTTPLEEAKSGFRAAAEQMVAEARDQERQRVAEVLRAYITDETISAEQDTEDGMHEDARVFDHHVNAATAIAARLGLDLK